MFSTQENQTISQSFKALCFYLAIHFNTSITFLLLDWMMYFEVLFRDNTLTGYFMHTSWERGFVEFGKLHTPFTILSLYSALLLLPDVSPVTVKFTYRGSIGGWSWNGHCVGGAGMGMMWMGLEWV